MRCPKCGSDRSSVVDSRGEVRSIRRRRECQDCEFRFTTFERVEFSMPFVVKKDGRREQFFMEKLQAGVLRACEKRPVSAEEIEAMLGCIEQRIQEQCLKEISSVTIGDLLMEELKKLDHIAYVRFASVYREFTDINQFVDTLQSLTADSKGRLVPHKCDLSKASEPSTPKEQKPAEGSEKTTPSKELAL